MAGLLGSAIQDATPVAAIGTAVAAVIGFAGLLVRQLVSQQGGWQELVTAAERRAEMAEKKAEKAERSASASDQKATAAVARADLLDMQLDEVRRQIRGIEGGK